MHYTWEIETSDGTVLPQYTEDGKENSWKNLPGDSIVRISFVPRVPLLPKHTIIIDPAKEQQFIRRFGRGFIKQKDNFQLSEYVNCVVTNQYRFWLFGSNGSTLITEPDYELYI